MISGSNDRNVLAAASASGQRANQPGNGRANPPSWSHSNVSIPLLPRLVTCSHVSTSLADGLRSPRSILAIMSPEMNAARPSTAVCNC